MSSRSRSVSASASAPDSVAPASSAAAARKRKASPASASASAAASMEPPVKVEHVAAGSSDGAAAAPAKANRRSAKRAKAEALAASEAAAAEAAQIAAARPVATQRRAEKRARVSTAKREEKQDEDRALEAFLFGNEDALLRPVYADDNDASAQAAHAASSASAPRADAGETEAFSFEVDTAGAGDAQVEGGAESASTGAPQNRRTKQKAAAAAVDDTPAEPQAAWQDEDDTTHSSQLVDLSAAPRLRKLKANAEERFITGAEYSKRLRAVFEELNPGTASWATLKEDASDADITTLLLQSASSGTAGGIGGTGREPGGAGRGEPLPSTTIDLLRLKDANLADVSQSVVSSVRFHPGGQLMLTAGLDKMIRIFQVDGTANAKVQGIWTEDMPIMSCEWLPSSLGSTTAGEIIATGRRQHFYSLDIESSSVSRIAGIRGREEKSLERMVVSPSGEYIAILGNDGYILLLSGKSKQFVGSVKLNGSVRSASFSRDGKELYSVGSEGQVYVWDLRSRKPLAKMQDEGNISGTCVAVGGGIGSASEEGFMAVGSESGVVNMYHTRQLRDSISLRQSGLSNSSSSSSARLSALSSAPPPAPLKSLMHLTTPIDELRFNHDGSLLAMSSRRKKDSLKLVHTPSRSVFANWPTSSTPLHYVSSIDFSPNSGYLAIGNDRGRVLLYRLTHFPRA